MKALVTGGAGFIGSHLVERLLSDGQQVRVLDNLTSGRRENLPAGAYELIQGDVRDREVIKACMEGIDQVYHLAALVSVPASIEDPELCYGVNLIGSLQVLRAAMQAAVERVVLASSAAVYGDSPEQVKESTPSSPLSPYAASKLAMEQAAQLFTSTYNLPTVCLRFFNVYGPRQSLESQYAAVVPAFVRAALLQESPIIYGDGQQRRDFVFVADAVEACLLAADRQEAIGSVLNVGGGGSVTIQGLADILQRLIPDAPNAAFGPEREGDIRSSEADLSRAQAVLGYRPATTMDRGLHGTIEWFRQRQAEMQL